VIREHDNSVYNLFLKNQTDPKLLIIRDVNAYLWVLVLASGETRIDCQTNHETSWSQMN